MDKRKNLYLKFISVICLVLIILSALYRFDLRKKEISNDDYEFLKDKTIVRVWLPKDRVSNTREYQIQKFNEDNKNIYIMLSLYDNRDYDNILKTALAAEKGPDIMIYGFFELIKDNYIKTLDDIDSLKTDDFVYFNGNPIGVRVNEENVKFIWNKDIFKKAGLDPNKPPKNWNEVLEYSRKIKKQFPDIVPFQFPLIEYEDFKQSIGEPSVNLDKIYTSFWDYENGVYNFDSSKEILKVYNKLYNEKLLDDEFDKKSKKDLRTNFYQGNVAMHISTFEDKGYFSNIIPLNFETGISNLPKFNDRDKDRQYYLSNSNFLCVNKNTLEKSKGEQKAVKQVLQWLTSEDANREILSTRMAISPTINETQVKNDIYKEYNEVSNFKTEVLDPSIFISRDSAKTVKLSVEAIKGDKSIDEVVKELNYSYKEYCDLTNKYRKIQLNTFKK
ncbi:ABC transporter substrate-binding protein [Clostridium rectalis]|uniref:ABC transporter substrate-binding protein n=1 Tax=Clostridium rectalis TaxID=2040295 RepID=UPI000F6430B9|nr:extracellular solute-binding protein [Clostridium rectalis]